MTETAGDSGGSNLPATLGDLRVRMPALMLRDQRRLERRADRIRSLRDPASARKLHAR